MNTPLFSVLIAQYNNGKYLLEAIDSVVNQSYTNWEIILVDDCSTDNSHEIYQMLTADKRIKIFFNEKNEGVGYTKRRCAELAGGDICGYLDPDDALLPNALADMMSVYAKNKDVAMTFSRFYKCDENLNITGENRLLQIPEGKTYFTAGDHTPEHFVSFKKAAYNRTEGVNPLLKGGADQDLYYKMEEAGELYILDKLTYKYRISPTGISVKNLYKIYFYNYVVQYETCKRRGLSIDDYPVQEFINLLSAIVLLYKNVSERINNSRAYKLGKMLLKPLKFFRK
ncbi:MAG: glycosyltransferase [Prevotellaceae bacterium]|jgi:glycosyltransferase involved in cell wall biosynthesis|nr:glycosyltransferase [Prevotellaceae bacterium]